MLRNSQISLCKMIWLILWLPSQNYRLSWKRPQISTLRWRKKSTSPIESAEIWWRDFKIWNWTTTMQTSGPWSVLCTSLWRMMSLMWLLPITSICHLRESHWAIFSKEKLKVFIFLEPKRRLLSWKTLRSSSELVVGIFPSTNSSDSTCLLSWKKLGLQVLQIWPHFPTLGLYLPKITPLGLQIHSRENQIRSRENQEHLYLTRASQTLEKVFQSLKTEFPGISDSKNTKLIPIKKWKFITFKYVN